MENKGNEELIRELLRDHVKGVSGALFRYRILAFIVGVGLCVLVFIGMPLQYFAHSKVVVAIVGPIHGFVYIVYLAAAFDLFRRRRWSIWQLLQPILAGLVPGVAFVVEHLTTKRVKAELVSEHLAKV